MKNSFLLSISCVAIFVSSCGPAAEDREIMHKRAKIFQDSIATIIRASMDQAAMKGAAPRVVVADTSRKANVTTPAAAGTATSK